MSDLGHPRRRHHASSKIIGVQSLNFERPTWFSQLAIASPVSHTDMEGRQRTADFLPERNELFNRDLGAFHATNNRPLSLVLDGFNYNRRKVLSRCQSNEIVIGTINHNGSAPIEIDWGFENVNMLGRLVGIDHVLRKQPWLEQTVLKHLAQYVSKPSTIGLPMNVSHHCILVQSFEILADCRLGCVPTHVRETRSEDVG